MKKKNVVFVFLFIMLFSAAKGTTLPPPPGWGALLFLDVQDLQGI